MEAVGYRLIGRLGVSIAVRGCHCVQRLSAHTRRPIATLTPTANRNPDRGG